MINKSLTIKIFSLSVFLLALSFPLRIIFLYKIPFTDLEQIFSILTTFNLISMLILSLVGSLSFFLNEWIYKIIPVLLLVLFVNIIIGFQGSVFNWIQVFVSFTLAAF